MVWDLIIEQRPLIRSVNHAGYINTGPQILQSHRPHRRLPARHRAVNKLSACNMYLNMRFHSDQATTVNGYFVTFHQPAAAWEVLEGDLAHEREAETLRSVQSSAQPDFKIIALSQHHYLGRCSNVSGAFLSSRNSRVLPVDTMAWRLA